MLELAQAYLQYRLDAGDWPREQVAPTAMPLLRARAQLAGVGSAPAPTTPVTRPDQGHATARLVAGGGITDGRPFASLALSPIAHGPEDPGGGFIEGAAIEALSGELRAYGDQTLDLERLDLIAIRSLTPMTRLFQPLSWRLAADFERWRDRGGDGGRLVASLGGAVGAAFDVAPGLRLAPLLGFRLLAERGWPDGALVGAGPVIELSWQPLPAVRLALTGGYELVAGDGIAGRPTAGLGLALQAARNLSLQAGLRWRDEGGHGYPEAGAGLALFF